MQASRLAVRRAFSAASKDPIQKDGRRGGVEIRRETSPGVLQSPGPINTLGPCLPTHDDFGKSRGPGLMSHHEPRARPGVAGYSIAGNFMIAPAKKSQPAPPSFFWALFFRL